MVSDIYRISVCFVFASSVKVSIRNYTSTMRLNIDIKIDHFLSWLYTQDFCMFCVCKYTEGIDTKLHQHYKTKLALSLLIPELYLRNTKDTEILYIYCI